MTYGTVNSTDSRFTAGVNTLYSPSIGLSLDIALNAEAVDGVVINGPVLAYTPGILAVADIDYFPRGRVVVVWDAYDFSSFIFFLFYCFSPFFGIFSFFFAFSGLYFAS